MRRNIVRYVNNNPGTRNLCKSPCKLRTHVQRRICHRRWAGPDSKHRNCSGAGRLLLQVSRATDCRLLENVQSVRAKTPHHIAPSPAWCRAMRTRTHLNTTLKYFRCLPVNASNSLSIRNITYIDPGVLAEEWIDRTILDRSGGWYNYCDKALL